MVLVSVLLCAALWHSASAVRNTATSQLHRFLLSIPKSEPHHVCVTGNRAREVMEASILDYGHNLSSFSMESKVEPDVQCTAKEYLIGNTRFLISEKLSDRCAARWKAHSSSCDVLLHAHHGKDCEQLWKFRMITNQCHAQFVVAHSDADLLNCYDSKINEARAKSMMPMEEECTAIRHSVPVTESNFSDEYSQELAKVLIEAFQMTSTHVKEKYATVPTSFAQGSTNTTLRNRFYYNQAATEMQDLLLQVMMRHQNLPYDKQALQFFDSLGKQPQDTKSSKPDQKSEDESSDKMLAAEEDFSISQSEGVETKVAANLDHSGAKFQNKKRSSLVQMAPERGQGSIGNTEGNDDLGDFDLGENKNGDEGLDDEQRLSADDEQDEGTEPVDGEQTPDVGTNGNGQPDAEPNNEDEPGDVSQQVDTQSGNQTETGDQNSGESEDEQPQQLEPHPPGGPMTPSRTRGAPPRRRGRAQHTSAGNQEAGGGQRNRWDPSFGKTLIIDNGSGRMKAGHASGGFPDAIFNSIVGDPKYPYQLFDTPADMLFHEEEIKHRGVAEVIFPIQHGIIVHKEAMLRLWKHTIHEVLSLENIEDWKVLMTEPPLNPNSNRRWTVRTVFEEFNVGGFYLGMQAVLAIYAAGSSTGLVVDIGDGVTHIVPIVEGYALPHAIKRLDVAGRDLTDYMRRLLTEKKSNRGRTFITTAEREIAMMIKEKTELCYVALDYAKELEKPEQELDMPWIMPDDEPIQVGSARFRVAEPLFQPDLIGVESPGLPKLITESIYMCDVDVRLKLFARIYLTGGTSLFEGIVARTKKDVEALIPSGIEVNVNAMNGRENFPWMGAANVAGLPEFERMWFTKEEYASSQEDGLFEKHAPLM